MALKLPSLFHGAAGNSYSAARIRRMMGSFALDVEGVLGGADMLVVADSPASLRARVSAGRALVNSDYTNPGVYLVENDSIANAPFVGAADPTNPRIDLLVLRVHDLATDGGGGSGEVSDTDAFEVVAGTAAASPVAPLLPSNAIPLAELRVNAGATTISTITDRRPFATLQAPALNLAGNTRMDAWSRGTATPPDGWSITNGTVAQDTTNVDGTGRYAAGVTNTASAQGIFAQKWGQATTDGLVSGARGRVLTCVARVRATAGSRAYAFVNDGVATYQSTLAHTGGGSYETLIVSAALSTAAVGPVTFGVLISTGASITVQVASCALFVGGTLSSALGQNPPLAPTLRSLAMDELFTQRVYEHGQVDANLYGTAGGQVRTPIQFETRKAGVPTVTLGTPTYTNASAAAALTAHVDGFAYGYTVTALGMGTVATGTWDAVV
jgi:hypothetical protein